MKQHNQIGKYTKKEEVLKGKKGRTIKKPIHKAHIDLIQLGKFIPGLFLDLHLSVRKTRKRK